MPFVSPKWGLLALTLALPAVAAQPAVWGDSAMAKVRPQTKPGTQSSLRLKAARNEFISFQVGLHGGDTGLRGVRAQLDSLEGPARISGADVTLYREDLVTTTRPSVHGEPVERGRTR